MDGQYILLSAEIAAVAEVEAPLLADRPCRPTMSNAQVLATLSQLSEHQLNAELVEKLLSVTPPFPPGNEVGLSGGGFEGHLAVVVRVADSDVARPVVRVFQDASRQPFGPREVALADRPQVRIQDAAAA